MRLLIILVALLATLVTVAHAQQDGASLAIARAKSAIAAGDLPEAERLLLTVTADSSTQNELDFLMGTIAGTKRDYPTAIAHFKALLDRDPSLNRVRLELARAYFFKGDDDTAAEHYFRTAAAQGVPPGVQKNIDAFLDQIRRRKRWTITVSVAALPDSNVNAATAAQTVDLFGIPFELADAARQKSGIGLAVNLGGSYQWDIAPNTRFKVGAGIYDAEYGERSFTDRQLSGYAGPKFFPSAGLEFTVLGTASQRWYGGQALATGAGGRVEGRVTLSPRVLVDVSLSGQQMDYASNYKDYTGPELAVGTSLTYALDFHRFVRGTLRVTRQQTSLSALRNTQYVAGAGYYHENLPLDFAAYLYVESTLAPYDAPYGAFGVTRRDWSMDYRFSVSNKNIDILGFTPVITFAHTDRYSNIGLFAYHRNHGEIGLTRNF